MRSRLHTLFVLMAVLFSANRQADAELISLQLQGQVSDVVGNPFGFGLRGGEPFSARFTYDPTTQAAFPNTSQTVYYQTTSYTATVAGHSFSPVAHDWFVFMSNDSFGDFITFSAGAYPAGYGTIAIDGVANPDAGFIVSLLDTTATLWDSVTLPDNPFPPLSAFDRTDTSLFSDDRLGPKAETFHVNVTELQQVPETGTLSLLALGIAGLSVWMKRDASAARCISRGAKRNST